MIMQIMQLRPRLLYPGPEPWELVRPTGRLSQALRSLESHVALYYETRSLMLG